MPLAQPPRRILITDGEQRASLAVARSLGASGHNIYVCATSGRSLAGASRFARSEHVVASSLSNPKAFTADIKALVASLAIDTIIPMTEPALLALLPVRNQFPDALIPFADSSIFSAISDKEAVLNAAALAGIAVPQQTVIKGASDAAKVDAFALQYPLVVKPARSVAGDGGDRLKLSVQHADSATELGSILDSMDVRAFPLLLQQRIVGDGIGIFVLLWNGELIAQFAHRRIREKPPSGGVSVYRSSIPVDPELLRLSCDLLSGFSWEGVAMVEYKLDGTTGTPYLMEINGRFWGSLQLAIDAGVDFPKLLIDAATGNHPSPVTSFDVDVRSRWFWGDVDHLLARIRKSREQLSLTDNAPSRWQAIRDFFSGDRRNVSEICRRSDPKPFLRESVQWFRQLGK